MKQFLDNEGLILFKVEINKKKINILKTNNYRHQLRFCVQPYLQVSEQFDLKGTLLVRSKVDLVTKMEYYNKLVFIHVLYNINLNSPFVLP